MLHQHSVVFAAPSQISYIMKFRAPISLFEEYTCSTRKPTLIISQVDPPNNNKTRSTKIWNTITPKLKISDYILSVACLRSKLKLSLLTNQHIHSELVWTNKDFDCSNLVFTKTLATSVPTGLTHPNQIQI